MAFVASRLRSGSGTYNPLADGQDPMLSANVWICSSEHPVVWRTCPSPNGERRRECAPGQTVTATKEGNWLREERTGLYAPYCDESGQRNFKNQRTYAMELATGGIEAVQSGLEKRTSRMSNASTGSAPVSRTASTSSESTAAGRHRRFSWVDTEGRSHRIEGESELIQGVKVCPEVWICVAAHDVPYRSAPDLQAATGMECPVGSKINAIKDNDWLRVFDVTETVDAAEMLGRRSLTTSSHTVVKDTGLYLPFFTQTGERLFKNEKVALYEASKHMPTSYYTEEKGSCSLM